MPELSSEAILAGLAVAALIAVAVVWRITRAAGLLVKFAARLGILLFILGPILIGALSESYDMGGAPNSSGAPASPPSDVAKEEEGTRGMIPPRRYEYREGPSGGSGAPQPSSVPLPEGGLGQGAPPPTSAPPPDTEMKPGAPAPPEATDASPPPPSPAPAPVGGAAPPPTDPWDVVPVYYGTDRTPVPGEKRLDYGSGRGRKLELGLTLVTVPKTHQEPAIERPWALKIPYTEIKLYEEAEDPNKHFTIKEVRPLSRDQLLAMVRERLAASQRFKDHAFIFVHGYNTSFDFAMFRTAQIAYDLKFDGAPFAYSWPSGGGIASYTYDRESSGQCKPFLRDFMKLVINESGAKSVSVIAHSMGNLPVLDVLKDLKNAAPPGVIISQLILAAPDVDRDNFENIAEEIEGLAQGVTLYTAANDRALQVSRNFYGGVPRAGDVPPAGPLVLRGMDTIDATAVSMDSLGLHHSGYAESNVLLRDIAALIETGVRPPKSRTPTLEEVTTTKGLYWRYPAGR